MLIKEIVAAALLTTALLTGGMDQAMPDKDIDGTYFLVNRDHRVSSAYVPETVDTPIKGTTRNLRAEASEALKRMADDMKAQEMTIMAVSGYRSYAKQNSIYRRKIRTVGSEKAALKYVAPPGASEHQLGLAMDLGAKGATGLTEVFGKTAAGKWVAANGHLYGFIIRYPKEWTEVTGYSFEPWHVRYVGVAAATRIFNSGEPMEYDVSHQRVAHYAALMNQALEVSP